jgi:hypothetical protein
MESSEPETVLESLIEVAELQRDRVLAMFAEEMKRDLVNHHLNASLEQYSRLLLRIQGLRFDLGLDEKKRWLSREMNRPLSWKERAEEIERNGRETYKAYAAAEEIFAELCAARDAETARSGVQNLTTEVDLTKPH